MSHYDRDSFDAALASIGIEDGDVAFSHVGLAMLGFPATGRSIEDATDIIVTAVRGALRESGTWIVPTYSYSFTKGDEYDPATTSSDVGPLTEHVRLLPGFRRSLDPIFSVTAAGPATGAVVDDLPQDCFGPGCVYERLIELDALILNVGVGFRYATFVHHVEQHLRVPYRYAKRFGGTVVVDGEQHEEVWQYFVRPLDEPGAHPDLRRLEAAADAAGIVRRARVGLGELTAVRCRDLWELAVEAVKADPWFLSRAGSESWEGPKPSVQPELDDDGAPLTVWRGRRSSA